MIRNILCLVSACLVAGGAPALAAPTAPSPDPVGDLCAARDDAGVPRTQVYRLPNGATVVFVAVVHASGPDTASARAIKAAFDRYRPTMVLVEGTAARDRDDPAARLFLRNLAARRFAAGDIGENIYAVKLASDAGVGYAGWDLSPRENAAADIAAGFAPDDILGAHLFAMMMRHHDDPSVAPPADRLRGEANAIPQPQRPQDFDYAAWYARTYGKAVDPLAGTPCGTGIASRIIKAESVARTRMLVQRLEAEAKPGAVVLVEAGANHWFALRDYLAGWEKRAA